MGERATQPGKFFHVMEFDEHGSLGSLVKKGTTWQSNREQGTDGHSTRHGVSAPQQDSASRPDHHND
jgi:hypothetical protein